MPNPPEPGPSRAQQRKGRIRRARIVATTLSVVATVALALVLATTDPTRAASPSAVRTPPTAPVPGTPGSGSNSGSGSNATPNQRNDDGGFGSINNGGDFNLPNTQTHGS